MAPCEIAAAALQPGADPESLEPLFVIAIRCLRPVRLGLVQQFAGAIDVTAQQLQIG